VTYTQLFLEVRYSEYLELPLEYKSLDDVLIYLRANDSDAIKLDNEVSPEDSLLLERDFSLGTAIINKNSTNFQIKGPFYAGKIESTQDAVSLVKGVLDLLDLEESDFDYLAKVTDFGYSIDRLYGGILVDRGGLFLVLDDGFPSLLYGSYFPDGVIVDLNIQLFYTDIETYLDKNFYVDSVDLVIFNNRLYWKYIGRGYYGSGVKLRTLYMDALTGNVQEVMV
jgi:hypothetical protein